MRRATPVWVAGVLLFLAAGAVRARWPRATDAAPSAAARELRVERDPRRMSARELRQLPGVGATLALVLARARDAYADERPLAWDDVPGIGPVRAAAIRAWFRARGVAPDPLARGRYAEAMEPVLCAVTMCVACLVAGCGGAASEGARAQPDAPSAVRATEKSTAAVAPFSENQVESPASENTASENTVRARTVALAGGTLHALEAGPVDGPAVVLLHGARYSARTWEELGTLGVLARAGYHALALDWPGYGASPDWGEEDPSALLASVCSELGSARVALVGPSMGGGFALAFLAQHAERVSAFVGVAPAGAQGFAPESWSTPTLLVWGERDDVVPLDEGRALAKRLRARLEVLPGASHACYLDQPERFHALLLEFLAGTRASQPGR